MLSLLKLFHDTQLLYEHDSGTSKSANMAAIELLKSHKYGVYYGLPDATIPWGGYHVTILGFAKHSLDILDVLRRRPAELDMSHMPVVWCDKMLFFSSAALDDLSDELKRRQFDRVKDKFHVTTYVDEAESARIWSGIKDARWSLWIVIENNGVYEWKSLTDFDV